MSCHHVFFVNPVSEYHTFCVYSNRTNLDPWDQYSDAQIWEALEKTHIKEMVSGDDALVLVLMLTYYASPPRASPHICA